MSADPARAALDAEVLTWMGEAARAWPEPGREDEARFERLAHALFAFQFEHCAPYRRFCEGRGRTPETLRGWREIPAVPTGAFKEVALRSFPAEREAHRFRTSGTSTDRRGTLHLDTLALYEASLLPTFRRHLLPDLAPGARAPLRVLAPAAETAPDSSLSHMFSVALRELGTADSGCFVNAGEIELARLLAVLDGDAAAGRPVLVCGTAFAFVHVCDALAGAGRRIALPEGSRAMETGGFKGRAREVTPGALRTLIEERLSIPAGRVVDQYGMTELGSQFYDSVLCRPGESRRKLGPPWARARVVDPDTGADVPPGEAGALAICDLANTGSVIAVQTADVGRRVGDGFEIAGREPGAEARGCSLAADAMFSEAVR